MPEIIGPDGNTYYSADHFDGKSSSSLPKRGGITDSIYLILGVIGILLGLWLLAEIAVGLFLLFLGSTGVNYRMMKKKGN